jgi:hemerythrin-like domain-containing protein
MTKIIEILREEHRNIEELLLVLEQELNVFDRNEQPDYEILQAVMSYFRDYPDCCHHPKEDMIFEKLKARDPVAAGSVGDLEAEHQNEGKRLQRLAQMIRSILTHHEVLRPTFDDIMRDFIEHERKHMEMEERVLFPAAVNALQPEDWAGIDANLERKEGYDVQRSY